MQTLPLQDLIHLFILDFKMKKILLSIIIGCSFLPLIEMQLDFVKEEELKGWFQLGEKPDREKWINGDYQKKFNNYFNDHFGFRNFFVRINNQLQHSVYNKSCLDFVTSGKEGQMHQTDYINSYLGNDYIGYDSIYKGLEKLDFVRDQFKKNGTEFIVVIAPGKLSFMPESLPDRFVVEEKDTTNYDMYAKGLKEKGINLLDLREYFGKLKKTTKYPLYSKGGVHWNGYAITLAADTLISFIEKIEGKSLNHFTDIGGEYTSDLRGTDDDISSTMNLLFPFDEDKMYYPELEFEDNENAYKPNVLVIGDSYAETFYRFYPFYENCFDLNTNYWSYNHWEKWPLNDDKYKHLVASLDMENELLSRDIVILIVTQMNMKLLGTHFVNRQYEFLKEHVKDSSNTIVENGLRKKIRKIKRKERKGFEKEITDYEHYLLKIWEDEEWMKDIKENAENLNVSVDTMLVREAREWAGKKDI